MSDVEEERGTREVATGVRMGGVGCENSMEGVKIDKVGRVWAEGTSGKSRTEIWSAWGKGETRGSRNCRWLRKYVYAQLQRTRPRGNGKGNFGTIVWIRVLIIALRFVLNYT